MYDENYDGLQAAYLSQLHGCDELDHRLCFESTFFCTIALVFYTPPNICETNVVTNTDDAPAVAVDEVAEKVTCLCRWSMKICVGVAIVHVISCMLDRRLWATVNV